MIGEYLSQNDHHLYTKHFEDTINIEIISLNLNNAEKYRTPLNIQWLQRIFNDFLKIISYFS